MSSQDPRQWEKTALSIRLAKAIGGEIVSADSMQVYRHMDIGSAKVTPGEMDGVPHYLIDVLDPRDSFNVVTFQQMAKEALREIYSHGPHSCHCRRNRVLYTGPAVRH